MATAPLPTTTSPDLNQALQFAFKVVGDLAAAMNTPLIYIGDRLGIFKAMADGKPVTSEELAQKTGLTERYIREWMKAMIAGEYLIYDPDTMRARLSPEHALVLAQDGSPVFLMGLAQMIPDHYNIIPKMIERFQHGGGVPYSDYTHDTFEGTERLFETGYNNFLANAWIPAMPTVHEKLRNGAKVADVGCGRGKALVNLAKAYPNSKYVGYDNYGPNIAYGNELAKQQGLAGRLHFEERSANLLPQSGDFDLIMTCDCLHDMVSPETCARSIHGALKPDGTWFCIEPNMRDNVQDNINPLGKLFYSVSTLQCMTCSLAYGGAGYGAGMGEGNVRRVAQLAGFSKFQKLAIDNPFNQFFEVRK
ncbi:MAG: class I SAM-dependent methyltransferase [Acidobacteria bacterium]|nr:class I SAM-dependent methyltransferase [Acidobacteriota bacterium]